MAYSFNPTNNVIRNLDNYVRSFTTVNSDLMYNFYKEKVFQIDYGEILRRLGKMFNIPPEHFDNNEVSKFLGTVLTKYKEYEKIYMTQRDLSASPSTTTEELETIPLTLERYTATLISFLQDLKNGFNLFKVAMDRQQHFFKTHDSKLDLDETQLIMSNEGNQSNPMNSNQGFRVTPEEMMVHSDKIKRLIEQYIDTNIKKDFKYILELKLKFPH